MLIDADDLVLRNVEDLSTILTDEDEVILVDAQKGNSNIVDITGDEIICIDHHPESLIPSDFLEYTTENDTSFKATESRSRWKPVRVSAE